jgi:H+/Cl- antiporter ClcA
MSLLKVLPIVYAIVGVLVAIVSYVYSKVNPDIAMPRLSFWDWIRAILLYGAIFCVIFTAVTVLGAWLYNVFNKKVGSIEINLAD